MATDLLGCGLDWWIDHDDLPTPSLELSLIGSYTGAKAVLDQFIDGAQIERTPSLRRPSLRFFYSKGNTWIFFFCGGGEGPMRMNYALPHRRAPHLKESKSKYTPITSVWLH